MAKTFADTQKAVERIHTITTNVEQFTIILTVFFALIAFMIIFNTIRVAIYTERLEISIKKLVGISVGLCTVVYGEAIIFSAVSIVITGAIVLQRYAFLTHMWRQYSRPNHS